MQRYLALVCLLESACLSASAAEPAEFELVDGDRVVLVGNTFIERERHYGYLETMLAGRYPGRQITFRNLGWSGDTVLVQMRPLNFGSLETHITKLKPTVIFVCYGMNESFEGNEKLAEFVSGYEKMLDMLAKTGARLVLLSPIRHEDLGPPLPDSAEHNANLQLYVEAMRHVADERGYPLVDLYELLGAGAEPQPRYPLTENGIHPTAHGYWRAAAATEQSLGQAPRQWWVELGTARKSNTIVGTKLTSLQLSRTAVEFRAKDHILPAPLPPPDAPPDATLVGTTRVLKVAGLKAGRYTLKIDGTSVATASAENWARGVALRQGPEFDRVEQLRQTIVHRNRLFFYRWRAHNGEYIYGRRSSKSQDYRDGRGNAGNPQFPDEMKQFEELIAEADAQIAELASPQLHTYELSAESKVK